MQFRYDFRSQRGVLYITFIMGFGAFRLLAVSGETVTKLYISRVSARVFVRISSEIFQKALAFFAGIGYAKSKEIVSSAAS